MNEFSHHQIKCLFPLFFSRDQPSSVLIPIKMINFRPIKNAEPAKYENENPFDLRKSTKNKQTILYALFQMFCVSPSTKQNRPKKVWENFISFRFRFGDFVIPVSIVSTSVVRFATGKCSTIGQKRQLMSRITEKVRERPLSIVMQCLSFHRNNNTTITQSIAATKWWNSAQIMVKKVTKTT